MVSPFVASQFLWSFKEILPLLETRTARSTLRHPNGDRQSFLPGTRTFDHRTDDSSIHKDGERYYSLYTNGFEPEGDRRAGWCER
jgi:hypothetical protein